MRDKALLEKEIVRRMSEIPNWIRTDTHLSRTFTFKNFVEAFAFMTEVALLAERDDHHPEWSNVYGTVVINLRTHDCNGISDRDFSLAKKINESIHANVCSPALTHFS